MKKKKNKLWSYQAGEKGRNRVRVYEERKDGPLFLEFYVTDAFGKSIRKRLAAPRDREAAKSKADEIAASFSSKKPEKRGELCLKELLDLYLETKTPKKAHETQQHDRRAAAMFTHFYGGKILPSAMGKKEFDAFVDMRRDGKVDGFPKPVGPRQIAYDLKFLCAVFRWGTLMRVDGKPLVERHPFLGLDMPEEENPQRPMTNESDYAHLLEAAGRVSPLFRAMLVVAHETGRRIGSVRHLRWSDVSFDSAHIRWRAEYDKQGKESVTPATAAALEALREAQRESRAIGDAWVFPSPTNSTRPASRNLVRDWWRMGEKEGGIERVKRRGWHSLRRKFATELKDIPMKDLMHLGGWKRETTIIQCYQQPDEVTMRTALEKRRKIG